MTQQVQGHVCGTAQLKTLRIALQRVRDAECVLAALQERTEAARVWADEETLRQYQDREAAAFAQMEARYRVLTRCVDACGYTPLRRGTQDVVSVAEKIAQEVQA